MYRRLPKRGFTNRFKKNYVVVNVDALNRFEDGETVDVEMLVNSGVVSKVCDGIKVLGKGEITRKLTVKANVFSETAKGKIEAAGGKTEVI